MGEWSEKWRPQAPEAVATLERDVEQTLVFYQLDAVAQEWIRTTSLLERTNRELRRKFRQRSPLAVFWVQEAQCICKFNGFMLAGPKPTGGTFPMPSLFFPRRSPPLERDTLS